MVSLLTALSQSKHLLTVLDENSKFCEPMTTNVCRGEGEPNTNSQESTKYCFPRDQSISILLFTR